MDDYVEKTGLPMFNDSVFRSIILPGEKKAFPPCRKAVV